jgi:enamine deaminase RidA (YjgF/YER057c/UK114 family)
MPASTPAAAPPSPISGAAGPVPDRPGKIHRQHSPGLNIIRLDAASVRELHITLNPLPGEPVEPLLVRLAAALQHADATVVRALAFGSVAAAAPTLARLREALGDEELPVTWIEGAACDARPLAGLQLHAVAGTEVQRLGQGPGQARLWSDDAARHCVFSQLSPRNLAASRPEQARETFELLQASLAQAGLAMNHLVRTWFFLDDILAWYDDFNRVRNDFFARSELRAGSVPASTGVSGRNPAGAAVALAAWAVQPLDSSAQGVVEMTQSPKQCPAPAYGSAFSRAVEIAAAAARRVLVSGTASIEPGGRTAHVGDTRAQMDLTMDVIEAILESRGMSFDDVSRATAYYRHAQDAPLFADWLERHELRHLPLVHACCDICRDDLLFELELDALQVGC